MHNPDYLLHVSEGAEEISEMLHNEIIKRIIDRIMLRIGRGDDYILTAQDKWQLETLQQAGYLLEDIQKEIAKVTKLQQKEIAESMEEAGVKSLEYDNEIYRSVGLEPKPFTQSPELIRIAQRNYEATMGEFRNFTRTMALQSQQLFIKECDRAYNLVATGALSYSEAVKEVINNIVSDGVTVTYPSGHTDTIETATLRAVRTGISQMSGQIQLKRMEEMGHDRVIISSHLGARPSHHVWQGKIFTVEEIHSTNDGMPAYGTVTGLCGANCRHSFSPYFDFMENPFNDYDSEENKKMYEKQQRQRTLEKRIRDTKREVMGLKEAVDNCTDKKAKFELDLQYQKKAALLAKQNKAYNEYCASNNLRTRSDRIQIAKWDRKKAASARGAVKRYENAHGASSRKKPISISDLEKQFQDLTDGYSYDDFIKDFGTIESGFEGASVEEIARARKLAEKIENLRNAEKQPTVKIIKIDTIDEAKEALINSIGFKNVENINGIDEDLVINNTSQLLKLETKFGAIHQTDSYLKFGNMDGGAIAGVEAPANNTSQSLILDKLSYKNKDSFIEMIDKRVNDKFFMPCASDDFSIYSITHEYGHMIQNSFLKKYMNNLGFTGENTSKFINKTAKTIKARFKWFTDARKHIQKQCYNEIIEIAKEKNPLFVLENNISSYGKTNKSEFFAEVFANSQLGKPNELGDAMNEWLKRKGLVIE